MAARSFSFTSESVTEGHPDKVADQISDSVLDAVLADDPNARVACETLITTGLVVVAGEMTTKTWVDVREVVRERIAEIGYTRAKYGFDAETKQMLGDYTWGDVHHPAMSKTKGDYDGRWLFVNDMNGRVARVDLELARIDFVLA